MSTLFISAGPESWGSSRMRCYWPARYMPDARVITYEEFGNSGLEWWTGEADAFIFQKLIEINAVQILRKAGKQVWWDVCDPAWWWQPKQCREIADAVTGVVASSTALADDFNDWLGEAKAKTIPDRLQLAHFGRRRTHADVSPVRLIWFGVAVNRVALLGANAALTRLQANGYQIELTVMDDRPDVPLNLDTVPVYHHRWTLEGENEALAAHDIALLPQYPGIWGRVKSNNKMLTAWACGLPVATGNDYDALETLVADYEARRAVGGAGRQTVELDWTADKSAAEWELLCASS